MAIALASRTLQAATFTAARRAYDGGNGPVSRERADNIRALLYPKPRLPAGRIERGAIPASDGPWAVLGRRVLVGTVHRLPAEKRAVLIRVFLLH